MFYSCEKLHKTSKQKLFTECVYFEQDRITSCKTKNMFLFHCVVSDFALKQKQNVFVSLSFQWFGSETKTKCFCFTQFLMIWPCWHSILDCMKVVFFLSPAWIRLFEIVHPWQLVSVLMWQRLEHCFFSKVANSDQIKLVDFLVKVLVNFGLFSVNYTYSTSSTVLSEVGL